MPVCIRLILAAMAAISTLARISAPVLRRCMFLEFAHRQLPTHGARSSAWPPAMPSVPLASASSSIIRARIDASLAWSGLAGENPKRQHLQRIAHQDRGRLVERLVTRRTAAPQVVVVHGRQVIVHQRVSMDELDGRRRRVQPLEGRAERLAVVYTRMGRRRLPGPSTL